MAAETKSIRDKSRRVKNHILDQYLKLADRVDGKGRGDLSEFESVKYWELTAIFAKNAIPRTQELTGEDGAPISVEMKEIGNLLKRIANVKPGRPEKVKVESSETEST